MSALQTVPSFVPQPSVEAPVEIKADQLKYSVKKLKCPVYKMQNVPLTSPNGGTSLTLAATGVTQAIWSLPNDVYNLSRSYLQFDLNVGAAANPGYNSVFVDKFPIDSLQFRPDAGAALVDIQNFQAYSQVLLAYTMPLDEYKAQGPVYGDTAIGANLPISQCTGCNPCRFPYGPDNVVANQRADNQLVVGVPSNARIIWTAAATDVAAVPSDIPSVARSGDDCGGDGQQQLVTSVLEAGAAQSILVVRYRLDLGKIVGSLLAVDKDLFFDRLMQLVVNFVPLNRLGFQTVGLAGAASAALAAPAAGGNITNLTFQLAIDRSNYASEIIQKVRTEGIELIVPWTESHNGQSIASGTTGIQVLTKQITANMGTSLKRVMSTVIGTSNQTKLTANNFNVGSIKWSTIRTKIDSLWLQDSALTVANSEVYNYLYPLIKGSPCGMSQRAYDQNPCFIDNLSDCDRSVDFKLNDLEEGGYVVGPAASTYEAYYNIANNPAAGAGVSALTILAWFVFTRRLVIRSSGVYYGA